MVRESQCNDEAATNKASVNATYPASSARLSVFHCFVRCSLLLTLRLDRLFGGVGLLGGALMQGIIYNSLGEWATPHTMVVSTFVASSDK